MYILLFLIILTHLLIILYQFSYFGFFETHSSCELPDKLTSQISVLKKNPSKMAGKNQKFHSRGPGGKNTHLVEPWEFEWIDFLAVISHS